VGNEQSERKLYARNVAIWKIASNENRMRCALHDTYALEIAVRRFRALFSEARRAAPRSAMRVSF